MINLYLYSNSFLEYGPVETEYSLDLQLEKGLYMMTPLSSGPRPWLLSSDLYSSCSKTAWNITLFLQFYLEVWGYVRSRYPSGGAIKRSPVFSYIPFWRKECLMWEYFALRVFWRMRKWVIMPLLQFSCQETGFLWAHGQYEKEFRSAGPEVTVYHTCAYVYCCLG